MGTEADWDSLLVWPRRLGYQCPLVKISGLTLLAVLLTVFAAAYAGVPEGYEIGEETRSPDGRYALLYPDRGAVNAAKDGEEPPNLLVQLAPFKILTEIRPGVPQGATMEVFAEWSGPSTVAIHQFRKWGLAGLWVYELDGDRVARVHSVLDETRKIFRKDIRERLLKKYPQEAETIIFVSDEGGENPAPDFAFRGRKLDLNLFADNKPNLAPGPHWTARLKATWDLDTGRFEKIDFRPGEIEVRNP